MIRPLLRWPPYAVTIATFLALQIVIAIAVHIALQIAISRGHLPGMPDAGDIEAAVDVAIGSKAKLLALSIALNSVVLTAIALWASNVGLRKPADLVERLKLEPPAPLTLAIAILGLLGVTTALDSTVQLLGLEDFGALADIRRSIGPLDLPQRTLFAALIGVGPGVTEELFFRGYLLNRIRAAQGTAVALAVSSIFFGLFHADPVHTPLAAVMGVYLGLCAIHTGSLWVPIVAHAVNNALAAVTVDWAPTEMQAVLLVPLGLIAGVSAVVLLSRTPVPRRAAVW